MPLSSEPTHPSGRNNDDSAKKNNILKQAHQAFANDKAGREQKNPGKKYHENLKEAWKHKVKDDDNDQYLNEPA